MSRKKCRLCEQNVDAKDTNDHHLIPQSEYPKGPQFKRLRNKLRKQKIRICKTCHTKLHQLCTNHELACKYYTVALIREQPLFKVYLDTLLGRSDATLP